MGRTLGNGRAAATPGSWRTGTAPSTGGCCGAGAADNTRGGELAATPGSSAVGPTRTGDLLVTIAWISSDDPLERDLEETLSSPPFPSRVLDDALLPFALLLLDDALSPFSLLV